MLLERDERGVDTVDERDERVATPRKFEFEEVPYFTPKALKLWLVSLLPMSRTV